MELINLQCVGCGASLEVKPSAVIEDGAAFIVRRGQVIRCPYCGREYVVGEELAPIVVAEQFTAFDQRGQTVGAQVNITGSGNIIGNGSRSCVDVRLT